MSMPRHLEIGLRHAMKVVSWPSARNAQSKVNFRTAATVVYALNAKP
jgi:hypothetical protein